MNTKNNQAGFSLLEMMIVVAIMGIMISLIAPNLISQMRKAEITAVKADLNQIDWQTKFYYLDNYRFPTQMSQLTPRYFTTLPTDPWGNNYKLISKDGKYVVLSYGADGTSGGKGMNRDIVRKINLRGYRNVGR